MDENQKYPISYLAHLFPDMTDAQFERLVKSIQANGLRVPITVWRGEIIDGRHRYAACLRAGVKPRFEYLDDDEDPVQFVLDKNGEVRVLDTSGRAVVGYKLSSMSKPGRPVDSQDDEPQMTQGEAALRLGVSRRSVTNVGRVLGEDSAAIPTLRQAVASGRVKASDAAKAVDQSAEVQERALDRVLRGASKNIFSAVQKIQSEAVEAADAQALESNLAKPIDETITLHRSAVSDLSGLVAPASVDAIITNPPSFLGALPVFSDLAVFAAHALKLDGVMVVMNDGMQLPQVLEHLNHQDLKWISEFDLQHQAVSVGVGPPHWITLRRRSLLIYGKPGFRLSGGDNIIALPTPDQLPEGHLQRHLLDMAMALIVERFARPGQVVCDPIPLDRASTALAARKHGCFFIGADTNDVNLGRIRRSLARDEGDLRSESNLQAVSPEGLVPAVFPTEDALPDAQTNPTS